MYRYLKLNSNLFTFLVLLGLGIFILLIIVHAPIIGGVLFLVFLACLFVIVGYFAPELLAWLALLSIAISPQYIFGPGGLLGIETSSIHKLVILIALIPYTLRYGLREKINAPILVYLFTLISTYTLAQQHPDLSLLQPIKSFLGLTLGWFVYSLKWKPKHRPKYILSISLIATINIIAGFFLAAGNIRSFYSIGYLGDFRFTGSSIAAHLAMLAWVGIGAAMGEVSRGKKRFLWLGLFNFGILVATGTRGATLGALFIFMPYVLTHLKKLLRAKTTRYFALLSFVGLLIMTIALPNFLARTFNLPNQSIAINTSGRIQAWNFFWDEAMISPWFGRGLGAGTVANTGQVNASFRVPHNEYIRMIIDGGFIGITLIIISFCFVFRNIIHSTPKNQRSFLWFLLAGFFVYSFFDNTLSTTQFSLPFFWYLGIRQSKNIHIRWNARKSVTRS